ncbi:RNA-guided endonuclease InsQ/TnpB family protein [Microseira sp. BLCC-F43]|jgi:IS605 OrfB family transposase|uniref:RNA-guided endonuclease InsQ/TnpB family protein n=1 Tax=Microseira sp. BLCC-F43 TaxID=3153602 RepID=UPI0035BB3037
MQLAERHIIKSGHKFFKQLDALCFASKNLYNAANYTLRQNFIYGWGYLNYAAMYNLMKSHATYKALPAKVSQQILMVLDRNWQSFFAARSEYKKHPQSFTGMPSIPKYKHKSKGRNLLIYTSQAVSKTALNQGRIKLSGTSIEFKTTVSGTHLRQVRVVPQCDSYVIEVIYEQQESPTSPGASIAAIDLGLNNLAALTSNQKGFIPLLINGRPLKSINQFYNKKKSALQSQLKGNRQSSQRIRRLTRCRNSLIDNYLHAASSLLVDCLVAHTQGTLVIGYNSQWKNEINLGKQNNQNFVNVPHLRFVKMLTYKCSIVGIKVLLTEESYTSASSFKDGDFMPVYGEKRGDNVIFSGKRMTRGLYKRHNGELINADVNGSYNILRKAIPNAFADGIESCVVQPRRVTPL